jgi:hypothetical protein
MHIGFLWESQNESNQYEYLDIDGKNNIKDGSQNYSIVFITIVWILKLLFKAAKFSLVTSPVARLIL